MERSERIWQSGSMQDITVRRMAFEFPDEIDPVFIPGQPEQSYFLIGLSLLLPYLEPYLIRTMKAANPHITDADLLTDMQQFSAQEGQHYREHIRFNKALRLSGFPGIEPLEKQLEADYLRFTETKSLRFNLGYAEGFEALTTAAAYKGFESGDMDMDSPISEMMLWHLVEELEHRTVAFDVYDHVCGGYFQRLRIGLFAQWHMARFITRVANYMVEASPEVMEAHGGAEGARERRKMAAAKNRKLVPAILRTWLPGYTPHDIPFTEEMKALAMMYDGKARSLSRAGA